MGNVTPEFSQPPQNPREKKKENQQNQSIQNKICPNLEEDSQ